MADNMQEKENFKMMADQLKKDRTDTLARLKNIADSNTILAKNASDPDERKKNLKAANKASKEMASLQKQDQSTAGAVKKEFGNIGNSLLGGFDGMMSEAFGPLGGIASTLTTGLVRRKLEAKKNLDSDILQEEGSKEVATSLESLTAIEGAIEETSEETKKAGGEADESKEDVVAALGGVADASETGYEDVELGLWTKMEDHLNVIRMRTPTLEDLREQSGGEVDLPAADGGSGGEAPKGGGFMDMLLSPFKSFKKWIMTLVSTLGLGLKTAFASMGKTFMTTLGPQLLKFAGPLALIAGLALAVKDGIAGYFMADEWGVSKTSAVMGSVLGGTGSGFKNAFANAGKWALIGVGIGAFGGPPGMIIGGIIGAVIGGILGFIGGEKLSKGFDAVGEWFSGVFDTVVDAISAVWHAIMPKWFTDIDFAWTDLFPTGLVKLFTGEYFTVDVPSFSWYSLFPNFLVEWFKGTAEKIAETPFSWTDIFPKFLKDFFSGEIAKDDYVFKWSDLFPEWLVKVFDATSDALTETPFHWYSLFPDWIVNLFKGVEITGGTKAFEWTDIFPGWLTKIFKAGKKAGTTEGGGFDWTQLLPDWMAAAWDSTKAIGEKTGITPLFEMIKKIFTDLFKQIMNMIPGKETLDKVMKVVDDPIGAVGDAAGAVSDGVSSGFNFLKNKITGNARGGVIVNRPSYLPSTGTVVGEHGSWSGKGNAHGGIIPMDGGPEAIIPLTGHRMEPIAQSIAGAIMNNLAMDRVGLGGNGGGNSGSTTVDSSTQQVITNNTIINSPEPQGPVLPGAGRDHAISHFRHVA